MSLDAGALKNDVLVVIDPEPGQAVDDDLDMLV
jgi:hypothetical protein